MRRQFLLVSGSPKSKIVGGPKKVFCAKSQACRSEDLVLRLAGKMMILCRQDGAKHFIFKRFITCRRTFSLGILVASRSWSCKRNDCLRFESSHIVFTRLCLSYDMIQESFILDQNAIGEYRSLAEPIRMEKLR
jgi:hypothetical protein